MAIAIFTISLTDTSSFSLQHQKSSQLFFSSFRSLAAFCFCNFFVVGVIICTISKVETLFCVDSSPWRFFSGLASYHTIRQRKRNIMKKKIILIKYVWSIIISGEIFIVSQGAASNGRNAENIISIWKFYDMNLCARKTIQKKSFLTCIV